MKKTLTILLLILTTSNFAQDYTFGKVSKDELAEKFYPLDSTANAAYLYKYKKVSYNYSGEEGWEQISEVVERIKIYNKEGLNEATKQIAYYKPESGRNESITRLKAITYNLENGKIIKNKLSKKEIFDEKRSKSWSIKKLTFPSVKEGAVLELRYKVSSPYSQTIESVILQEDIPIKKNDIHIRVPQYFVFKKYSKGYLPINLKETKENRTINYSFRENDRDIKLKTREIKLFENIYKIKANDIPALEQEDYVGNINNYRSTFSLELSHRKFPNSAIEPFARSWEDVSKQIHEYPNFGSELNKSSYYKDDLQVILANSKTDLDKINAIFQWVKSKVKWNGSYSKYAEKGVRKAYRESSGNVADINLMLTSMLRSAELNAYPVLVSSRGNGVPLFPTLEGFDYVISMVKFPNNSYVLLDATEPYSLPNVLPTRVLNWNGRVVTKNGASSWVKLTSPKYALEENTVTAKITDDFTVEGLIRTKYDNLNALNFRNSNNHITEDNIIRKLEDKYKFEIEDYKVLNKKVLGKPIVRSVQFISEDLIEEINDKLYIEPIIFLASNQNPFKLTERKFPVDFITTWKDVSRVSIEIPSGYKAEFLPETLAIGLPEDLGVFKYQVTQVGNKIKTISIIQFNQAIISPEYYAALKGFYNDLVKKQSEKIVLVKKK
jgi:hypothetical protein